MKKSRNTRQRGVILDILRRTGAHPTAEMIYRDARKAIPNISLGTVYRNLGFLRDQGVVREIRPNDGGSSRFEGMDTPHAHFHCVGCSGLLDIPLPAALEKLEFPGTERISVISAVDLHVIGSCRECATAGAGAQ
ncbi:MAG: transcriptional repressor [Deltaproteobacteria bacterium]|nr:transcriptional repressor [Deltaproteobacteria bacterium]